MDKPRDEQGRFTPTNPNPWVRNMQLPQYHPAHSASQTNVLLRRLVAARGNEPIQSEVLVADMQDADINDLLRQIVVGDIPKEQTE